jgi:hypothetical protein
MTAIPVTQLHNKTVKGRCGICLAGCWVNLTLTDGKIVDIAADPDHSLGMLCRRGQHAPEIIYSPNRLKYSRRRVGPKGDYEFERISWDQAYDITVAVLAPMVTFGRMLVNMFTDIENAELLVVWVTILPLIRHRWTCIVLKQRPVEVQG